MDTFQKLNQPRKNEEVVAVKQLYAYTQPFQYNDGIAHVIVNGVVTLENGKHTEAKAVRGVRHR